MNHRVRPRGKDTNFPQTLSEDTTGHLVPEVHGTTCGGAHFVFFCDGWISFFRERIEIRPRGPLGIARVKIQISGALRCQFVDTGIYIGLGIELTKIF